MHTVRLPRELADLLKTFAEAYRQPGPDGQKVPIMFYTALGTGTSAQHHGLPNQVVPVSMGDLEDLFNAGLIDIRYGRGTMDGSFRVTLQGYDAVAQIEEHDAALASASVVPTEGARIGLDWQTQVFPVLEAVHTAWSKDRSERGVSQDVVNAELGRESGDTGTSLVLRKLEEAGYVEGKIRVDQVEGPLFCEPTPQALELLAGWPTNRGDLGLARLVGALETQIEQTPDPEEKGKLRAVRDGILEVGEDVMAKIVANIITGG